MVEDSVLDRAYAALADPTRRRMLETLRAGDARITDLAEPLPMSFAGVSRHVAVLETAGLVRRASRGPIPPKRIGRVPRALAATASWSVESMWRREQRVFQISSSWSAA